MNDRINNDVQFPRIALTATILVFLPLAWLLLVPNPGLSNLSGKDNAYHLLGFAALTLPGGLLYPRFLWWVLPLSIFFGGMSEFLQSFVGRQRDLKDFLADAFGATSGAGLGLLLRLSLERAALAVRISRD